MNPGPLRHGALLGSKLRQLRKRNGLTLDELSARCVQLDPATAPSVSYLSMLETGKRTPSSQVLAMIAGVFGKPAGWFLDGSLDGSAAETRSAPHAGGLDIDATAFEPAFLFSPAMLRHALPELLLQTGTSGPAFAQLLIRVWQETQQNDFPDIERAAQSAGGRELALSLDALVAICARHGLAIRWVDDDRRRLNRGLARARFEAPGTLLVSRRLRAREERLKYELAFFLGHKLLHNGDGAISAARVDRGTDGAHGPSAGAGLGARDALHAWREFECSFFAGALLLPRAPFRRLMVRESHRISMHRKLGVGPAVVMRRMTAVSTYRHWHFFDGYPPGHLRTVYRGNGIPLPWGNLSVVPDPCPHWAVFRLLREDTAARGASAVKPTSQISAMLDDGAVRLYCCHSLLTRDAADETRVLSVGIDLAPALSAQGYDVPQLAREIWDACQRGNGARMIPAPAASAIGTVAHVLRIGWVSDALDAPAQIICPRSSACPRGEACGGTG
jgi:transcriptional regulator with XRE-family HTH domain